MSEQDRPQPEQPKQEIAEHKPRTISRRDLLKGVTALGVASALGIRKQEASANALITAENVGNFTLKDIAEQMGITISFSGSGSALREHAPYRSTAEDEGNGIVANGDLLWNNPDDPALSFRPTKDVKDTNWDGLGFTTYMAENDNMSYRLDALLNLDMGPQYAGSNGNQFAPDWLINSGYNYNQGIQAAKDNVDSVIDFVQKKGDYDLHDPKVADKLGFTVLAELVSPNITAGVITDVNNPTTWYKPANYLQQLANNEGDTGAKGLPRYIKDILLDAKAKAGHAKLGISDYDIETWNDYTPGSGGGPNQKAQVMYNLVKILQADPDLKGVMENFYVGMQAHWDAAVIQNAGVDVYAKDVAETVKRFKELGVDVKLTELTIAENNLQGLPDEQDQQAAEVWGKVPPAAVEAGASELTIFHISDIADTQYRSSLFDANYNKKPGYKALAEGLISPAQK